MKRSGAFFTAVLATSLAGVSFAAQVIEEIVVTATKRNSTVQDVPFSINAQTADDIRRSGARSIEDLSRNVAALSIQNLGPGQSQVAIRGVSAGQIVRDQPGVKEQVGVYLDETLMSLSLFTPDLDLYDLNRVETLRGPQGTLFGSGSVGGTIRYITNQPVNQFQASVQADMNTVAGGGVGGHLKGMVNLPLTDYVALRVVGYNNQVPGFIDALGESGALRKNVDSGAVTGTRVSLRVSPNDTWTITPRVVYQDTGADGFNRQEKYNLFANPFTTTRPAITLGDRQQYLLRRESFRDKTRILDITVSGSFNGFDVTAIAARRDRSILVSRDASALSGSVSIVPLGLANDAVALPSNLRDSTDLQEVSQELRFSSNTDTRLDWVLGFFRASTNRNYNQRLPTPGYDAAVDATLGAGTSADAANGYGPNSPFNSDLSYAFDQFAAFGEITYDLTDRLHVTAGGRYYDFSEVRSISSGGFFANGDTGRVDRTVSDGVTPRVIVSYDMSDNITVNAQASQGFRLGGVNDPLNPSLCSAGDRATFGSFQSYDDETLWNYELGMKARPRDNLTVNLAVFRANIDNLQVTMDAGSCSSRISFNVGSAQTTGVEWEISAAPLDNVELSASGSFIKSEFTSTVMSAEGNILGGVQHGNRLASVPKWQLAGSATWFRGTNLFNGAEVFVSGTVQYVGDRFTQPGDQVAGAGNFVSGLPYAGATGNEVTALNLDLDPYALVYMRAGLRSATWEAVAYVENLTDKNANLSFDRERGGRARLGFRTNRPRTAGVTVRRSF